MIIECPPPELKAVWGTLAHVSEQERKRILALPFGCFRPAVKDIERQLKELKKKAKARAKESAFKAIHRKPVEARHD